MRLSELGRIVLESLEAMPRYNPGIMLFGHVVMPDHVHFNVHLAAGLPEPLKVLGEAIRRFKHHTSKAAYAIAHGVTPCASTNASTNASTSASANASIVEVRGVAPRTGTPRTIWQRGYHDHLCLCRSFIDSTERYIAYNVPKWELMHGGDKRLYIHEPLFMPRLDAADYWKGVGNLALLDPREKLLSLRISREVKDAAMAKMLSRIENAVSQGYIVISGFISPGEKAVRDMLCGRRDARFIRMLPSCIPNARFRPESRYIAPFMEERYLEIARGNDEAEFGRAVCLDLNDEIIKIATSAAGLALYWQEDGLYRMGDDGIWRKTPKKERQS